MKVVSESWNCKDNFRLTRDCLSRRSVLVVVDQDETGKVKQGVGLSG